MTIRNPTPEEAANILRQHTAAPFLAVVRKALDWCEANPELFSLNAPALDADDNAVLPLDPAAVKFCFFGRVAVEAGIKLQWLPTDPGIIHYDPETYVKPAGGAVVNGEPLQDYLGMIDITAMDIIDAYQADTAALRNVLLRWVVEEAEVRYGVAS